MIMEGMREILKGSLGRSLHAMREEDRLAAAWTVACGRALAERGSVVGFKDGIVLVEVNDSAWMLQMVTMRSQLATEIARIARVKVVGIHFELKKFVSAGKKNGDE